MDRTRYQQKLAGNTGLFVFGAAVLFVFLVLAAQYESWSLPLSVILIVPMCLLAAVTGLLMRGLDVNVLSQVGFVVLVGLAAKNAILDRRVCQAGGRRGQEPDGSCGRARRTAPAADPHDLLRLHPWRGAAGDRERSGRRDAHAPWARPCSRA